MIPGFDEQELAKWSGGRVTEYPQPGFLDKRAVTDTIKALRQFGVINENQTNLIPGNLSEAIATYVVNERTLTQVARAAQRNNSSEVVFWRSSA